MKRVIIELPESHSDAISITAVGFDLSTVNLTTNAVDLNKGTHLSFDGKKWLQSEVKE